MRFSALLQRLVNKRLESSFVSALLFAVFYLLFYITPVSAQTNTNPDVSNNPHLSTQSTVIEIMSAITCQIAGIDPINPKQKCLGVDQKNGKIGFVQGGNGALGVMGNMISMLYTPPLHTVDYFQNLAQNFGIAKPAHAQGTGFDSLAPLLKLWSAFRNIVYLLFVIIFVVIGFAIMLRVKIDPRTVMTIQNQIPKIIVGLILVTFSFAIAGFLIDLMWIAIYLTYGIISGTGAADVSNLNPATLQGRTPFAAIGPLGGLEIVDDASHAVGDVVKNIFGDSPAGKTLSGFITGLITLLSLHLLPVGKLTSGLVNTLASIPFFGGAAKAIAEGTISVSIAAGTTALFGSSILSVFGWGVAFVIIAISLLFALFRLWFSLLVSYVYILINVVLAPFWIIAGLIPGSQINFTGWLKDILANLAAFPAVIGLLLLGNVFKELFGKGDQSGHFVPPLIGNPGDPSILGALISIGIIFITPNVVNLIKTAIKAPKIETGIGRVVGVGTGVTGIPGKIGQIGLMIGGLQHIFGPKGIIGRKQEQSKAGETDKPPG